MSSIKQRGEKIMVIGTQEFLDFPILSDSEQLLKAAAERDVFPEENGTVILPAFLSGALHCDPQYMSWAEFDYITGAAVTNGEYFTLRFMFACFIYQALGGEI